MTEYTREQKLAAFRNMIRGIGIAGERRLRDLSIEEFGEILRPWNEHRPEILAAYPDLEPLIRFLTLEFLIESCLRIGPDRDINEEALRTTTSN